MSHVTCLLHFWSTCCLVLLANLREQSLWDLPVIWQRAKRKRTGRMNVMVPVTLPVEMWHTSDPLIFHWLKWVAKPKSKSERQGLKTLPTGHREGHMQWVGIYNLLKRGFQETESNLSQKDPVFPHHGRGYESSPISSTSSCCLFVFRISWFHVCIILTSWLKP